MNWSTYQLLYCHLIEYCLIFIEDKTFHLYLICKQNMLHLRFLFIYFCKIWTRWSLKRLLRSVGWNRFTEKTVFISYAKCINIFAEFWLNYCAETVAFQQMAFSFFLSVHPSLQLIDHNNQFSMINAINGFSAG